MTAVHAQEVPAGDPVRGGQLWDNWFNSIDSAPPPGDHPLWSEQAANPRSGAITWRCKECHGWDYKGLNGAYAEGSHYTGFPGVRSMVGRPTDEIMAWLDGSRNPDHNFALYMNDLALQDLAAFLRVKLVDTALLVDSESNLALGSPDMGEPLYHDYCEVCHGEYGSRVNFSNSSDPVFLGDLAVNDPWNVIHKIRFGHPATVIPAGENLGWSLQQVADLLAYIQTLAPEDSAELKNIDPESGSPLDVSGQGDTQSVLIGALIITLVIFGSLGWSARINRWPRSSS